MKSVFYSDRKRRILFNKHETTYRWYKYLLSSSLSNKDKLEIQYKLSKLPKDSSISRIRNRCIITGKGNSVSRLYKVTRMVLKELSCKNKISGVKPSSW
jgi:ribosomal protein S14